MRDEIFLDEVIAVAKRKNLLIELAGSILGHAYYKFRKNGITVYSTETTFSSRVRGRKVFRKMVRDRIPDNIAKKGERVIKARVSKQDAIRGLVSKVMEEALELYEAKSEKELIEELADIYEVLRSVCAESDLEWAQVTRAASRKRKTRGSFATGILLLETSLPQPKLSPEKSDGEISIALEDIEPVIVSEGLVRVPFLRLLARGAPPVTEFSLGDEVFKVTILLSEGCVEVKMECDEPRDAMSAQMEMDLETE